VFKSKRFKCILTVQTTIKSVALLIFYFAHPDLAHISLALCSIFSQALRIPGKRNAHILWKMDAILLELLPDESWANHIMDPHVITRSWEYCTLCHSQIEFSLGAKLQTYTFHFISSHALGISHSNFKTPQRRSRPWAHLQDKIAITIYTGVRPKNISAFWETFWLISIHETHFLFPAKPRWKSSGCLNYTFGSCDRSTLCPMKAPLWPIKCKFQHHCFLWEHQQVSLKIMTHGVEISLSKLKYFSLLKCIIITYFCRRKG
jgi:hypothetical protein